MKITRILCEALCAAPLVCRSPPVRCPPSALLRASPGAAKYIYIDAFSRQTVTRQTLLRYTDKSVLVNSLIRGNLWKIRKGPILAFALGRL